MKIIFLGTAAAEGWPAMFCNCIHCQKAQQLGEKNLRSRSAVQIDKKYRIDLPPDSYWQMQKYKLSYFELEHLLITHTHLDHFCIDELHWLKFPFTTTAHLLNIYGNKSVEQALSSRKYLSSEFNIAFHLLKPFEKKTIAELVVTPIIANHATEIGGCFNYIIEVNNKRLLVGYDTGWYDEKVWDYLYNLQFDIIILDCTNQDLDFGIHPAGHLDIKSVISIKENMQKSGSINTETKFIVTHFSHNGGMLHDSLERRLSPYHIIPAYDGLEIDL